MTRAETMVRMGELAVSAGPDDVLTSIGLGSCIGLALVDAERQVAGLAHVMLPARPDGALGVDVGKFADTAAPALLDAVLAAGARRARLATYLVGGAQMFTFGGRGMDVGTRNGQAVRDAVAALGLRVRAADTGGTKGRTMRVHAVDGRVTAKASGGEESTLSPTAPAPRATAPDHRATPLAGAARVPSAAAADRGTPDRTATAAPRRPAAATPDLPRRPTDPRTRSALRPTGVAGQSDAVPPRVLPGLDRNPRTLRGV